MIKKKIRILFLLIVLIEIFRVNITSTVISRIEKTKDCENSYLLKSLGLIECWFMFSPSVTSQYWWPEIRVEGESYNLMDGIHDRVKLIDYHDTYRENIFYQVVVRDWVDKDFDQRIFDDVEVILDHHCKKFNQKLKKKFPNQSKVNLFFNLKYFLDSTKSGIKKDHQLVDPPYEEKLGASYECKLSDT